MKSKSILTKFLIVLTPIYLALVLIGSFVAAQILIRDTTDILAARIGGLAARVSLAIDIHEAHTFSALAQDLIAPLGVDPAVICVELRSTDSKKFITAHPPALGCKGQQHVPFEVVLPIDDFDTYSLHVKFTDEATSRAVNKQIVTTVAILALAFLVTLISAAIGFRMIVSRRLLSLHDAIRMAANNLQRRRIKPSGMDELTQIINAYNTLMDQDAVREKQLTAANKILMRQSRQDPLTGLYNRRYFSTIVTNDAPEDYQTNRCGAIMLLDIDLFKLINDQHGHATGDEVLIKVGKRLNDCLPNGTPVVRWGGEEILVYMKDMEYAEVDKYAAILLSVIGAKPITTKAGNIPVTTSIGVVRLPFTCGDKILSPEQAVNLSDAALYEAKATGRNRAIVIAEQQFPSQDIKATIENEFAHAREKGLVHVEVIPGPPTAKISSPEFKKAA